MTINVVGGSGFIGTRLSRVLTCNGQDFRIIDKQMSPVYQSETMLADVRSVEELSNAITDNAIIINLAAEHRDDVTPLSLYYDVNVQGARNICLVANKKNVKKIIFTSSVAIYGFAPLGTDETGKISPFNEYGRTKYEAEKILKAWQLENPLNRTLVIVRPTVVFGEQNRGNVYNLLRQISSGLFVMVGDGENRKSMAYVGNVAAFLHYALTFKQGIHIYNYIDKPDFTMNQLVSWINQLLGRSDKVRIRLPYWCGVLIGKCFDLMAALSGKKLPISAIRVKKFCATSVYESGVNNTGFVPPVSLQEAIDKTIKYEFIDTHNDKQVFYSE